MSAYTTSYQPRAYDETGYGGEDPSLFAAPETAILDESYPPPFEDYTNQSVKSPKLMRLSEVIKQFVTAIKQVYIQQKQKTLSKEGPSLVRFLCFTGGFLLTLTSTIFALNFFLLFRNPCIYLLHLFQGFFGVIIMIVEAKNWDCIDQFKPWTNEWFRFLTIPIGKAGLYIFLGIVGTALKTSVINVMVGLYFSFLGLICFAIYSGKTVAPPQYDEDGKLIDQGAMVSLLSDIGQESTVADDYRYPLFQEESQNNFQQQYNVE